MRTSFDDVLEEMKVAPTTKLLKLLEHEIASCAHRWRRRPGGITGTFGTGPSMILLPVLREACDLL